MRGIKPLILFGMTTLLLVLFIATFIGSVHVKLSEIGSSYIVWNLRVPRLLMNILVGASLSVIGSVYQSIFRNPMADPYITGTSSGAQIGLSVGLALGYNTTSTVTLGFLTSLGASLLLLRLSKKRGKVSVNELLLLGMTLGIISGAVSQIVSLSSPNNVIKMYMYLTGSFNATEYNGVIVVGLVTLATLS